LFQCFQQIGCLGVSWKSSWQEFDKLTGIKLSQERVESSDDNLIYLRSSNHPVILGKRENLVLTGFWKKEMFLGGIDVRKNDGKDQPCPKRFGAVEVSSSEQSMDA